MNHDTDAKSQSGDLAAKAAELMPGLVADLERLVAIPSVAFPGYPEEPVRRMADVTLRLFREAGFTDARLMDVPTGYPPIYGEIRGPEGSPTVMLYAHYDVQPAPAEQGWTSDPWTATTKDDSRIYGRGASDDKAGLVAHLGTLRIFDGTPPCTVKLILEGMEETESNLEAFVEAHPELFDCDLFVICDMGNLRVGEPAFTTALRGDVACVVTVRTLEHPLHSGVFGGPAPDAMMALARLLATLHDDDGNVAVEGVSAGTWEGEDFHADDLRASADILDGVQLTGTGPVGDRLWAHPSINAIGIDMTSIAGSSNVLIPSARAKISMRIVPGSDPATELDALVRHLETHAPWGARVEVERTKEAPPFLCDTSGPGYAAARWAMETAFGKPVGEAGCGGSIPLLRTLQHAVPNAEFVLWGPEDVALSRIHSSDESVDPQEIERLVVAQALLLQRLGTSGP
ncbi:dipeptidase [Agromyces aurantiacus]|uniref:Dipeptidase n=1 Tax=Agromyces aurantiacus TaxID=165814 RepID=A0ABV9R4E4_9MICO|nr:dipeptidase [Agromyces aurantiacus]MBM7503127.1 acetylornithine deacetylase/succinyl-diaminopimelate desuccinylase-like protein [Agromyces aurantiacus]